MVSTRTITLALAIAAVTLLFAAVPLVATHQAQAQVGQNDNSQGNNNIQGVTGFHRSNPENAQGNQP